jgi:hypothetical protein
VGPADRVVVVGLGRAEVLDARRHELGRLDAGGAVEDDELVEAAVGRALAGGAVVAHHHVHEGVVEDLEVGESVDEAADVMVGVLHEAGVDLHLPGEDRLEVFGHVVPRGDLAGARRELGVAGTTPSSFWRASVSSRSASQPASKRPLYLADHSAGT